MDLNYGKVEDAIARFSEKFRFTDHGIGLDFNDKERLGEFLQKSRELDPDSFLQIDAIFECGDHVITEWTFNANHHEPFYGQFSREIRVSLHGVSVVRTEKGKITEWSDYYDGLVSRRAALASYFTKWVEL